MIFYGEGLTRVAVPIKVVLGVAVALVIYPELLVHGAVGEGDVVVRNVVEEVDVFFRKKQCCRDGVDRRITPSFVEETALVVEVVKKVDILL